MTKIMEEFPPYNPYEDVQNTEENLDMLVYFFGKDDPNPEGGNMSLSGDLQKLAGNALTDIQNTYQAFLMRDSSYGMFHSGGDLSQDVATQEAARVIDEPETPQPTQDLDYER